MYANFVATLDGVVAIPSLPSSNEVIAGGNDADRFLMGLLRAVADTVLVGAGVLRASPRGTWRAEKIYPPAADAYGELRRDLGLPPAPEIAIVTGSGSIDPAHPVLAGRAVVLTSDAGADRLSGRIPDVCCRCLAGRAARLSGAARSSTHSASEATAGSSARPARTRSARLLQDSAIDELFLTRSPFLAGDAGAGSRLRLVEAADLVPLVEGRLLSIRRHDEHLFTRYAIAADLGGRVEVARLPCVH